MSTSSILHSTRVRTVLDRLFETAKIVDGEVIPRAIAEAEKRGIPHDVASQNARRDEYMSIDRPTAMFLYNLVRLRGSGTVVEFGTSFGISTIHLAAAVKERGSGRVISTEMEPTKVEAASSNLAEAGLADVVTILPGDAFDTLAHRTESIDVLFLDGWKDLYLPLLKLVEPKLAPDAVIVADDLAIRPEALAPYLRYVRDPSNGYTSVEIPIDDVLEFSVRG